MAEIDKEVRKVIEVERVTIANVPSKPTLPTTQPKRRYIITPKIVRIDGVYTPPNVPKPELSVDVTSTVDCGRRTKGNFIVSGNPFGTGTGNRQQATGTIEWGLNPHPIVNAARSKELNAVLIPEV